MKSRGRITTNTQKLYDLVAFTYYKTTKNIRNNQFSTPISFTAEICLKRTCNARTWIFTLNNERIIKTKRDN